MPFITVLAKGKNGDVLAFSSVGVAANSKPRLPTVNCLKGTTGGASGKHISKKFFCNHLRAGKRLIGLNNTHTHAHLRAVHKARNAPGEESGLRKCDSL